MFENLTDWITIFLAGQYDGMDFSESVLDQVAANYDPSFHEAPLCIGHPADSEPAYGWIAAVRRVGNALQVKVRDVANDFKELWNARRFNKLSVSFYPNLCGKGPNLRHLGALGAMPPKIKGMPTAVFSDDDGQVVVFSFSETGVVKEAAAAGGDVISPDEMKDIKWIADETVRQVKAHFAEADAKRAADDEKRGKESAAEYFDGTRGVGSYDMTGKADFVEKWHPHKKQIDKWHTKRDAERAAASRKQQREKERQDAAKAAAFSDDKTQMKGSAAMATAAPGTPEYYAQKAQEADATAARQKQIARGYYLEHTDEINRKLGGLVDDMSEEKFVDMFYGKIEGMIAEEQKQSIELTDQMVKDYYNANLPEMKKMGMSLDDLLTYREISRDLILSENWSAKADFAERQLSARVRFYETNLPAFDALHVSWDEYNAAPDSYTDVVNRKAEQMARMFRNRR